MEKHNYMLSIVMCTSGTVRNEFETISLSGAVSDGDKVLCVDTIFQELKNDNCLVYSFGIANDWSFEKSMAQIGCKASQA